MNPHENNSLFLNQGTIIDANQGSSENNQNVLVSNTDEQNLSAATDDTGSIMNASASKNVVVWQMVPRDAVTAEADLLAQKRQFGLSDSANEVDKDPDLTCKHQLISRSKQTRSPTHHEHAMQKFDGNQTESNINLSSIAEKKARLNNIDTAKTENVRKVVTHVAKLQHDLTYKDQAASRRGQETRSTTSSHHGNSNLSTSPLMHEINRNNRRQHPFASNAGAIHVDRRGQVLMTNPDTSNNNTTVDTIIGENEYVNSIPLAAEVYEESNNVPIAHATVLRQYSFKKIFTFASGMLLLIIAVVVTITVLITKRHVRSTGSIQGAVSNSPTPAVTTPTASPTSSQHIGTSENLVIAIDKYLSGGENQTEVINQYGPIKDWDVTNIKSFSGLFSSNRNMLAANFSEDLSNWDVSDAVDMESMFSGALHFDGNISGWNVSSVTNMNNMFNYSARFDGDLSLWDVGSVTNMEGMFRYATKFSGKGIDRWQTNRVSTMKHMFQYATSFNANLSAWDITSLKDAEGMFDNADSYDGIGINEWNTSAIESMIAMFYETKIFNANLSKWNTGNVKFMDSMFDGASKFQGIGIDRWNVSSVTSMFYMFYDTKKFDEDISRWDVSSVTNMEGMFHYATKFSGKDLGRWQISRVSTMKHMFRYATSFNANLSAWDVTGLKDVEGMFDNADSFIGIGINEWNTSGIESMIAMFYETNSFDADLSKWNTGNVKFMDWMFTDASMFHGIGVDLWDTKNVMRMRYMFRGTMNFDANLSNWDTSKVTTTPEMFKQSKKFIGIGLENWNTSQIVDMSGMFEDTESFDANLSQWDVSNVRTMRSMFEKAKSFRGAGLETWNVWNVNDTAFMFQDAVLFDANLSNWDIGSIESTTCMFDNATSFRGVDGMDVAKCV